MPSERKRDKSQTLISVSNQSRRTKKKVASVKAQGQNEFG
jgi:hypothetical protein